MDDGTVGDQTQSEDLDAAVSCNNNLRDSRHTDNISTDGLQESALSLGFVRRARDEDIDALVQELWNIQLLGSLVDKATETRAVGVGHGSEAGSKLGHVGSDQRVGASHTRQVDVILNDANIANLVIRVQSTSSVCDYEYMTRMITRRIIRVSIRVEVSTVQVLNRPW